MAQYAPQELAEKYGISRLRAKVIIGLAGGSRQRAEEGAKLLVEQIDDNQDDLGRDLNNPSNRIGDKAIVDRLTR
ncbi:MAG: hypothetical protein ABS35_22275 [Kaistia sp. SCN 65-12]|jgi:hypothetical protein|nr:MAG: hypothetical protein ABS35_22275 [Kaistia sp. SCN 65-12]